MPEAKAKKVFCSHRSTDKPAVEAFARRLRAAGIDAWFDGWEIAAGDDLVARINQGLEEADFGLIFFSGETLGSPWVSAEVSALIHRMITEGRPIIPVMIDADAEVPALLRPRARRGIEEFDSIVDAILNRSAKPPLGPSPSAPRVARLVLRLTGSAAGRLALGAELDGEALGEPAEIVLPPALRRSFGEFLSGRLKPLTRGPAEATAASLEQSLEQLGQELGQALLTGAAGETLSGLLSAGRPGDLVEVTFEAEDPVLLSLPVEAAHCAAGATPRACPSAFTRR